MTIVSEHPVVREHPVSIRGRTIRVPSVQVGARTLVVTGRYLRVCSIHDAEFIDDGAVVEPDTLLQAMTSSGLAADLVTFSGDLRAPEADQPFAYEWDNAAVARATSYDDWWNGLPQESRKNVRRAAKRGVSVELVPLDDALARRIKALYDESPLRQGRRFWHYGKPLERVKQENSSYLDRSDFIGAYCSGELIGFMKVVYANGVGRIMQILASATHQDKRPMNAMLAKAMELCHQRGMTYLVYSKFTFGNKKTDDMAEFKRRNGFVQLNFPKYFVPLTLRGRAAFALGLHRGALGVLPPGAIDVIARVRKEVLGRTLLATVSAPRTAVGK